MKIHLIFSQQDLSPGRSTVGAESRETGNGGRLDLMFVGQDIGYKLSTTAPVPCLTAAMLFMVMVLGSPSEGKLQ